MKNNQIILMIVVAVVVGGLGFFGGMQYQKSQRSSFAGGLSGAGRFGSRTGNGSNRPVTGTILSVDDKSITVKLADGSSKIIVLSTTTAINKEAKGAKSDLTQNERVMIIGIANSDGSVTAQSIQLNPPVRRAAQN